MKALTLFFNFMFLSLVAFGQEAPVFHSNLEKQTINNFILNKEANPLSLQLIADASLSAEQLASHEQLVNEWVRHFQNKKSKMKNDRQFVSYLFYKVHRKLLKNYVPFTTFNQTLSNGNYDCLSGTTLYATLLTRLGVDFEVIETNYHIYLKVSTDDGDGLLESTDPLTGYTDNREVIAARLEQYNEDNTRSTDPVEYTFKTKMNHAINLKGLVGLQYYNSAVNAFNNGDLSASILLFEKAGIFYNSPRFEEFGYVLAQALINDSQMTADNKRAFLKRIPVIDGKSVVTAF